MLLVNILDSFDCKQRMLLVNILDSFDCKQHMLLVNIQVSLHYIPIQGSLHCKQDST